MRTPDAVTRDQLRAALGALGLPPEDFKRTRHVVIEPGEVTVTRYQLRDGRQVQVPGANAMATETEVIRVIA